VTSSGGSYSGSSYFSNNQFISDQFWILPSLSNSDSWTDEPDYTHSLSFAPYAMVSESLTSLVTTPPAFEPYYPLGTLNRLPNQPSHRSTAMHIGLGISCKRRLQSNRRSGRRKWVTVYTKNNRRDLFAWTNLLIFSISRENELWVPKIEKQISRALRVPIIYHVVNLQNLLEYR
jgi:hypothetical protein